MKTKDGSEPFTPYPRGVCGGNSSQEVARDRRGVEGSRVRVELDTKRQGCWGLRVCSCVQLTLHS